METIFQSLKNKVAVITGASSGIGKCVAEQLIRNGCHVILLSSHETGLTQVKKELSSYPEKVETFVCDVSNSNDVSQIAKKISSSHEGIDYLITCAGVSLQEEQGKFSEENFDRLIGVNLKGVYICTMLLAYPLMKEGGSIVNISSIRARTGTPSFSSGYAAAKAGVINLTKSFAIELAEKYIRVNCVAPGATYPTGLSKSWSEKLRSDIASSIPLKRLGKPEDISNAICFLLSDSAGYITGQTLDVNGGVWMN
jgi:3-oxoacyl-[acyl-carrier protein] reductase